MTTFPRTGTAQYIITKFLRWR